MFSQYSMFRLRADKLQRRVTLSQDTNISKNLAAFMHSQQKYGMNVIGYRNPGMSRVGNAHFNAQSSVGPSGSPFFQSAYILLYLHPTYSGLEERGSFPLQNQFPTIRLHSVTTQKTILIYKSSTSERLWDTTHSQVQIMILYIELDSDQIT